jgi:HD-GYP domain-containing protein (c-di-GMP phosphodiesterase class II)
LAGREKDVFNFLPETTARLLAHIPRLEPVASIVRYQFKHFDGSGFPADSVKGEEIPLGARMLKLLSDLIKLEERGNSHFKALHQLRATPGVYDPTLIEAALRFFEIFNQNREEGKPVTVQVTLAQLKINHILVGNVTTLDGVRIVAAGTLVSQAVLEKLQNFASISGVREPLLVEGNPVEPHQ